MSIKHWNWPSALAVVLAAMPAARAGDTPQMNLKLGLWEITVQPQMSGTPPLTDAQLQNIPPDRRAQIMAMMQSRMGGSAPHVIKECMTPEKLAKGFSAGRGSASNCQRTVVTNTGNELEVHDACTDGDRKMSIVAHFKSDGGSQASGTVESVITRGAQTMNVNATLTGKWLGASCGDIKDVQVEPSASQ